MILLYQDAAIYLWGFSYALGSVQRDLNKLKAEKLLGSSVETLSKMGYCYSFGLAENESLLSLASTPFSEVLQRNGEPRAIVFQHCYAQSAVLPWRDDETDLVSRNRYFAPVLM